MDLKPFEKYEPAYETKGHDTLIKEISNFFQNYHKAFHRYEGASAFF